MSTPVIQIENLGKRYLLGAVKQRARQHGYVALRDVISEQIKGWVSRKKKETVSRDEFWALDDISLTINQGDRIGIIGRNGAGKSTLLKILSRITEPTRGRITISGRVASLLEVGTGFHPELTGRENIYLNGAILGMTRAEIRRRFDEIVAFSEVEKFLDTPVKRYSSGMYVRLAFAVAAHLEPEILIVDEVLAVGDAEFQKKCLGKMQEVSHGGRTVLFVSHNMGAVTNLCSRGVVLKKGRMDFDGSAVHAVEHYLALGIAQAQSGASLPPHVLYQKDSEEPEQPYFIERVETYDAQGKAKPLVTTGDTCVFRITFEAEAAVENAGAVVMQFTSYDGAKVLMLSTTPDSGFPCAIRKGTNTVECVIEKMPFSGGEWILGVGIWLGSECACWNTDLCKLQIEPWDVYGSGFALTANRSLITTAHHWRRP
ncbi:MAG: polysaccharide ABC transporter ATP-binding protein [Verrucomicrobiota bacterium]